MYLALVFLPQIPNIAPFDIPTLVTVLGGVIMASPVIGYLLYAPFNLIYEYYFARTNRGALNYIENAEFAENNDAKKAFYQEKWLKLHYLSM